VNNRFQNLPFAKCNLHRYPAVRAALSYCNFSPKTKGKDGQLLTPRTYDGYSADVVMGIGTGGGTGTWGGRAHTDCLPV
jgi:hypothetical protein